MFSSGIRGKPGRPFCSGDVRLSTGLWAKSGRLSLLDQVCRLDRRFPYAIVTLLMVVAALLRLPYLANRPLWFDELYQVSISAAPTLSELLDRLVRTDRNPPMYALVLRAAWGLTRGISRGEIAARWLSFAAGVATVGLAWRVGRIWFGRRAAIALSLLVTVSPPFVFYSREARPYATGTFLVFAVLAAAARARRRQTSRAALVAVALLCASWQYASIPVTLSILLSSAIWDWRRHEKGVRPTRFWLLAIVAVLVVSLMQVYIVMRPQLTFKKDDAFFADYYYQLNTTPEFLRFAARQVFQFWQYLLHGSDCWWRQKPVYALAAAPLLLGVATSCRRPGRGWALVLLNILPTSFFLLTAGLHLHPFGGIRHCLPLAPGVLVLYAAGLIRLRRLWKPAGDLLLALSVAIAFTSTLEVPPNMHTHDVPGVLRELKSQCLPGDRLVVNGYGEPSAVYYTRELGIKLDGITVLGDEPSEFDDSAVRSLAHSLDPWKPASKPVVSSPLFGPSGRCWLLGLDISAPVEMTRPLAERGEKRLEIHRFRANASLWTLRSPR